MKYKHIMEKIEGTIENLKKTAGLISVADMEEAFSKKREGYVMVIPGKMCPKDNEDLVMDAMAALGEEMVAFIFEEREGRHEELVEMFLEEAKNLDDPRDDDEWLLRCGLSYKELYLYKHLSDAWQEAHRRTGNGGEEKKEE